MVCTNDTICDIRERNVTIKSEIDYKHLFPRVSGYKRVSDIMEVDIMEFRVYMGRACCKERASQR
jgi:hypothetical protein